jgi:hypothetical protein
MSDLGKFKNGDLYPAAIVEQSCPATFADPSARTEIKAALKSRQWQK